MFLSIGPVNVSTERFVTAKDLDTLLDAAGAPSLSTILGKAKATGVAKLSEAKTAVNAAAEALRKAQKTMEDAYAAEDKAQDLVDVADKYLK